MIIFLAKDTVLIGGSGSATIGMLLMGLKVVNAEGGKVEYLQAFIVTALLYMIVSLTMRLVLLVSLLSKRGRCLHDMMTVVFIAKTKPTSNARTPETCYPLTHDNATPATSSPYVLSLRTDALPISFGAG